MFAIGSTITLSTQCNLFLKLPVLAYEMLMSQVFVINFVCTYNTALMVSCVSYTFFIHCLDI